MYNRYFDKCKYYLECKLSQIGVISPVIATVVDTQYKAAIVQKRSVALNIFSAIFR